MNKDTRTLFPTAARLHLERKDTPHQRDDLSRIRVVDRDSPEGREILRQRAERRRRREAIEGMRDSDLALAGKLVTA